MSLKLICNLIEINIEHHISITQLNSNVNNLINTVNNFLLKSRYNSGIVIMSKDTQS